MRTFYDEWGRWFDKMQNKTAPGFLRSSLVFRADKRKLRLQLFEWKTLRLCTRWRSLNLLQGLRKLSKNRPTKFWITTCVSNLKWTGFLIAVCSPKSPFSPKQASKIWSYRFYCLTNTISVQKHEIFATGSFGTTKRSIEDSLFKRSIERLPLARFALDGFSKPIWLSSPRGHASGTCKLVPFFCRK